MKKKDVIVAGRKIKGVPYYVRDGKDVMAGDEVLEVERNLRIMKQNKLEEVNYREKGRA